MKRQMLLLIFLLLLVFLSKAQVSVTATAGTTAPTAYPTVNAAFAAINAGTHQGTITISVTGNTTEPASPIALWKSAAPSSYTSILIIPVGGDWVVNSPNQTDNTVMIDLAGADNVTIDGDPLNTGTRHLSFTVSPLALIRTAVFRLSSIGTDGSDGAQNNTIKNCNITGSRFNVNATTVSYGIYMAGSYSNISISNLTSANCTNNTFENNYVKRCLQGIIVNGTASTFPARYTVIKNNVIGSNIPDENVATVGINITNTSLADGVGAAIVEGNDVTAGAADRSLTSFLGNQSVRGIGVAQGCTGAIIRRNHVHDIFNPELPTTAIGGVATGIIMSVSTNNVSFENNFVRDITAGKFSRTGNSAQGAYGIHINANTATGLKVNYNTVLLSAQPVNGSSVNYMTACINIFSTGTALAEMKNNNLVNRQGNDSAFVIRLAPTNIAAASLNNNNYFTSGNNLGLYGTSLTASLANWQAATGQDANSININPSFVSATDLHIAPGASALDAAGTTIAGITIDNDGETRYTSPDIGADEFAAGGNALASTPPPYCGPSSAMITATGYSSGTGYSYQWQSSSSLSFTNPVDIGSPSASYSNLNTGVINSTTYFRLKVISPAGGPIGYSTIVPMVIDAVPNAGMVNGADALCVSGTSTFSSNGDPGGVWSSSNSTVASVHPSTGFVTALTLGTTNIIYTVTSGACINIAQKSLTVNSIPSASITYPGSPYCASAATATVTLTGTPGGTFSAPAGLVINPTTGDVNLGTSLPGTYTVTYFIAASGGCSSLATTTAITISGTPAASIVYGNSPYCSNAGTATVTQTGSGGGTYSATPGLVINSSNGDVDLASSVAGTHTVTYFIPATGGCSQFSTTAAIVITPAPSATIAYPGSPFCQDGGTVNVLQTGATGGTYSASPSGLSINASTGTVVLGTSAPGTYSITYSISAANGCAEFTTSANITINAVPAATILYAGSPYCANAGTAIITRTGTAAGIYTATPSGLDINATTGSVALASSTPGLYTVTYSVAAGGGCSLFTTSTSIMVSAVPYAGAISGILKLRSGQTVTLTSNGNAGGVWSSTASSIATISPSGLVTGTGIGTATINYTVSSAGCVNAVADTSITVFAATLTNLYPNPAREKLNVLIESPGFETIELFITDVNGRVIIRQSGNVRQGLNKREINVAGITVGVYQVKIIGPDGTTRFIGRFIKE